MTRMRLKGRPSGAIALLQLLVALTMAGLLLDVGTAELEFFQGDREPKLPDVSVQRLMRYLESKRHTLHHQQPQHVFPAVAPGPPQPAAHPQLEQLERLAELQEEARREHHLKQLHQQHLLELARQKERGLLRDDLPERPNVLDVLQRQAVDPLVYVHELDKQRLLPYLGLDYEPRPRTKPYSVEDQARARVLAVPVNKNNPLLDYPETHYEDTGSRQGLHRGHHRDPDNRHRSRVHDERPLAVGPDDPRYFIHEDEDDTPYEPVGHRQGHHHHGGEQPVIPEHHDTANGHHKKVEEVEPVHVAVEASTPEMPLLDESKRDQRYHQPNLDPGLQRRAEQYDDPAISAIYKLNNASGGNDVYLIAVVAGCSAAIMFAVVLISLTWCRMLREAKAAADVEYPAYGVTGPNKDASPSGDQRLAQSAQMYHFQHQKQQIIAMEKASAVRDAGSVSEAESDDENEEGDYTVYECPGLATTAEMEVKNPLFDDDLTPANQAKARRNGDV
ncbi:protein cab-1 [Copidosoma floridanum]|uniref:protein cab-1 n=1 Tax=Copidosoma floridanum TaxID=29053 RepID=UPI0006C985B3|nr:protein cab-1 [Copidosoma floridanum]